MPKTLSIDHLNSLLIVLSCLIAYILPFDLLIFSYAILGPAHYLTEISWLHDRKYFLNHHLEILLLAVASVVMFFFVGLYPVLIGFLVCFLFLSASSVSRVNKWLLTGIYGLPLLAFSLTPGMIAIIALLPTLIHVYLFTAGFMLLGALKNNNNAGMRSFILLIICGVSFFLPFLQPFANVSSYTIGINYALANIYSNPINLLNLPETEELLRRFAGFASFAYTYHYLNWFTKTKIIKWNQVSPARLYFIGLLYLFSVGVYLYSYTLGLQLLFFLSFTHVILELPLNALCFTEIFRLIKARYKV